MKKVTMPHAELILVALVAGGCSSSNAHLTASSTRDHQTQTVQTTTARPSTRIEPLSVTAQAQIIASAPLGWDKSQLGTPLDSTFQGFAGADGAPLFIGKTKRIQIGRFYQEFTSLKSSAALAANLSAFKAVEANISEASSYSYKIFRVSHIDYALELDESGTARPPPGTAIYYPWRVYMGQTYEVVFYGESSKFEAKLSASYKGIGLGASASAVG